MTAPMTPSAPDAPPVAPGVEVHTPDGLMPRRDTAAADLDPRGRGERSAAVALHDREGTVVAHAVIDADLAPAITAWRWSLSESGYAVRTETLPGGFQRKVKMHRVVMACHTGDGLQLDHINRDRLDNRRSNLRYVTQAQNNENRVRIGPRPVDGDPNRPPHIGRGVHWNASKRRWIARIYVNRRAVGLGQFLTAQAAWDAVCSAKAATT